MTLSSAIWTARCALSSDPMRRFEAMTRIGKWLVPDYKFKWPQMAWWHDADFNAYLRRFGEQDGMNADRRWNMRQLLKLVEDVPGDTAECGVFRGAGSWLICEANCEAPIYKRHHAFDSFEGVSWPSSVLDGGHWQRGDLAVSQYTAWSGLRKFGRDIELYRGWIPDRFPDIHNADCRRFSFVHIDVDLHQPTKDSIEFFYPRMSPGGIILCDDYGFTTCPGATKAIDDFMADKPEKVVWLSCGGGFIVKGGYG